MINKLNKLFLSFIIVLALMIALPSKPVHASTNDTTQVYYTSNFLQLYWGNIIFSPLATGQRVKNEISKDSSELSSSTTKYNRTLRYHLDLTDTVINRADYDNFSDYWSAYSANSLYFSESIETSIASTISSSIEATIGEEHIASLGAAIGASVSSSETTTKTISFTCYPGQAKSLYTYKAESIIYYASHKQTIQTRIFFWWSDGESSTTPGTVKTYGAGYDIVTTY